MAAYLQNGETNTYVKSLGPVKNQMVRQSDGPHTITYQTLGPEIESFSLGCASSIVYDFGPAYNCLVLKYDGKPGIVDLRIPDDLIKELPTIVKVDVFFLKSIPFQIISQDSFFSATNRRSHGLR